MTNMIKYRAETIRPAIGYDDARDAAAAINKLLGDCGENSRAAVEREIASCHPAIRDALRVGVFEVGVDD